MNMTKNATTFLIFIILGIYVFGFSLMGRFWGTETYQALDEKMFHLPQVMIFLDDSPKPGEMYRATTATAPGHHLFIGLLSKVFFPFLPEIWGIRVSNALVSYLLLIVLWLILQQEKSLSHWEAIILIMPIAASFTFLGGAIWIMTDNGSLLWICLTLFGIMRKSSYKNTVAVGLFAAMAVLWRQVNIWLLLPIIYSLWGQQKKLLQGFLAIVPPMAVAGYLFWLWRGFTPPAFQDYNANGFALVVPIYMFSLFGFVGVFYTGYAYSYKGRQYLSRNKWLWLAGFAIAGLAVIFPSTYDVDSGRHGGMLWTLTKFVPSFQDRSLVFAVLLPIGCALLFLWWIRSHTMDDKSFSLIFVFLIGASVAHMGTNLVYERYYIGVVFLSLIVLSGHYKNLPFPTITRACLGPVVFGILFLVYSILKIF